MILYNCFLNQLRKEKRKICPCPVFYSYIIAIAYLSFSLTLTALPWPLYRQLQTSLWHLGHKISRCLPQQLWKLPWRVSLTRAGETEKQAMLDSLLLGPVSRESEKNHHHSWASTVYQDQTECVTYKIISLTTAWPKKCHHSHFADEKS